MKRNMKKKIFVKQIPDLFTKQVKSFLASNGTIFPFNKLTYNTYALGCFIFATFHQNE